VSKSGWRGGEGGGAMLPCWQRTQQQRLTAHLHRRAWRTLQQVGVRRVYKLGVWGGCQSCPVWSDQQQRRAVLAMKSLAHILKAGVRAVVHSPGGGSLRKRTAPCWQAKQQLRLTAHLLKLWCGCGCQRGSSCAARASDLHDSTAENLKFNFGDLCCVGMPI
jgi:hypothetical protein